MKMSYQPPMLSAGAVTFGRSGVSSMASQYSSWEGWAIQSLVMIGTTLTKNT